VSRPADEGEVGTALTTRRTPRDVFIFMINGHKPKAPAAAMALIERLA
jgi:hypothetical protein